MTSKHQKRVGHRYIFRVAGEYVPVVQVVSWLLILLAMPVGALLFVLPGVGFPLPVVLGMAAAAVAATIAQGWLVERDNPLRSLAIRSAIGAIALLAEYGFIWAIVSAVSKSDTLADNEAGAGIVILAVPTFLVLLALIGLGFGIASVVRKLAKI